MTPAWLRRLLPATLVAAGLASSARAGTEIEFWHAMSGASGEQLSQLVRRFNVSQPNYQVVPVFKGDYEQTLNAGLAAHRAGRAPQVLHIHEAGIPIAMAARGVFRPVYQVMQQAGERLDSRIVDSALTRYFSDEQGRVVSMPFNGSTAALYYNRDAFARAALNSDQAPRTWPEVQEAALALVDSGAASCAFTTDRPSWVHVRNLTARHNGQFVTEDRGPRGTEAKLAFNNPLMMRHIGMLSSWVKSGIFTYYGRRNEGEARFVAGECAMFTGSSQSYADIAKKSRFRFGISPLPYYEDSPGAPYATLIDSASLWIMAGKKSDDYKAVARFLAFLAQPEVQTQWHEATGLLPLASAFFQRTRRQGFQERRPRADTAARQARGAAAALGKGMPLGQLAWIESIIDEELEAVWARRKTPMEALEQAILRGNSLMSGAKPARR